MSGIGPIWQWLKRRGALTDIGMMGPVVKNPISQPVCSSLAYQLFHSRNLFFTMPYSSKRPIIRHLATSLPKTHFRHQVLVSSGEFSSSEDPLSMHGFSSIQLTRQHFWKYVLNTPIYPYCKCRCLLLGEG